MKKYIAITVACIMIATLSFAQRVTPGVDARQHVQRARIHEGRMSGELTNREAARLNMQQRHIRRMERRAKSDGDVTRMERRRLHKAQNHANRVIRRQKNDDEYKRG
ncbi:MAG: hypothetical protein SH819_02085 [Cytophagales bacterium]|nr:hypothetical protein [Cytophagales bacterium]